MLAWLQNMGHAASPSGFIPTSPLISQPTDAGRRRRRYFVRIDGIDFPVSTPAEAQSLLDRAKTLARAAVDKPHRVPRETIAKVKPVKLEPPQVSASPELKLDLKELRAELAAIYRERSITLELKALLEREQRLIDDDEESMLLLQ